MLDCAERLGVGLGRSVFSFGGEYVEYGHGGVYGS